MTFRQTGGPGDCRVPGDRIHGGDGPVDIEAIQYLGDRCAFCVLLMHNLLSHHQARAGRPGRHQVQRLTAGAAIMGTAGCHAVDGDQLGHVRARGESPIGEAGPEKLRIDPVHDHPQPVSAGCPDVAH